MKNNSLQKPSNKEIFSHEEQKIERLECEEECKSRIRFSIPKKNFQSTNISKEKKIHQKKRGSTDEECGESYGIKMFRLDDSVLDEKEKIINEFLDSEKVEWVDPADKCYTYYNMIKKIMVQKRNVSCKVDLNLKLSNDLDMDSSPLMIRRKNKANTLSPNLEIGRLKEAFSMENLSNSAHFDRIIIPTKFKLIADANI